VYVRVLVQHDTACRDLNGAASASTFPTLQQPEAHRDGQHHGPQSKHHGEKHVQGSTACSAPPRRHRQRHPKPYLALSFSAASASAARLVRLPRCFLLVRSSRSR
jgi:hypothetical protein